DCGDLHQLPCTREGGKEFCFDPNHKIVNNVCQPCGADNQIGCPDSNGNAIICNDPQKFSWTNSANDSDPIACRPLPPLEQLIDININKLLVYFRAKKPFSGYTFSSKGNSVNIFGSSTQEVAESRLFTNMTVSSLTSLFEDDGYLNFAFEYDGGGIRFYTIMNHLTPSSTATFTCNDKQIVLPALSLSGVQSFFNGNIFSHFNAEQKTMGLKAWNDCKFHFGTNTIKIQKIHMVFNNGGTDIVYDYDLTNAPNNEAKLIFTYYGEGKR
ncbi:MAG: hypothetical protein AAB929_02990, partial [Patescibacteria group bacterium]